MSTNPTQSLCQIVLLTLVSLFVAPASGHGQQVTKASSHSKKSSTGTPKRAKKSQSYRLSASDVVQVKVFQEEDLTTELHLAKDGTATFPLLGPIKLGGKTIEQATALIRDLLGKDYLVNPQVSVNVVEYGKRRFTVMGQVQKPGSYELPGGESVTVLEAIAMAGGFTRLAVQKKATITRTLGGKRTVVVNLKSDANDPNIKPFEVQPDDTIIIAERLF